MTDPMDESEKSQLRPVSADPWPTAASESELSKQIGELKLLLQRDAHAGHVWERLGVLEFARGRRAAALHALETASLLVPLTHRGQLALASCYTTSGFPESARAIYWHLAAAIDIETELLADLAAGLGRVGEHELALAVCRDAAQRMPGVAAPLLGIARHLRRLRRPAATVLPYLTRAFELDPTNTECRISLAWILHACGRSVDGAELLDSVAVAEVECVPSLTRMRHVFVAAEDEYCASVCKYRLEALAAQRWRERP
jgi:tetratricopeptide (TPR) repeat protein